MSRFDRFKTDLLSDLLAVAPIPDGTSADGLGFTRPPKPELGDLALGAFPLAKVARTSPKELADRWATSIEESIGQPGSKLGHSEIPIARVSTMGPYVNLTLEPTAFAKMVLADILDTTDNYGFADEPTGVKVMIEYSAPNTNKPLHLGHIRNNLIGMSLSNVLEANGDEVVRVNLVNDRGIHICRSMLAYQKFGNGETPESTGMKGDHLVGKYYVLFDTKYREERGVYAAAKGFDFSRFTKESRAQIEDKKALKALDQELKEFGEEFDAQSSIVGETREMLLQWEAGDEAVLTLWKTMNEWVYAGFRESYARLGSKFDHWYYESETYTLGKSEVDRGIELGVFEKRDDGAVWAKLEPMGLKDKVVLRSDGTSVYITQDLGTAIKKHDDFGMDRSIYVVGSEQNDHFKNLFAMLELLQQPWASGSYHASYGMVTLPRGMGKLKSREGKAVDADALLDELHGLAKTKIEEGGYCEDSADIERIAEEIGQGALKLYILQVSSEKNIQFDPNDTISFTGDTGPAVQYSHARIQGILRKGLEQTKVDAADLEATADGHQFLRADLIDAGLLVEREERDVLRLLADYPSVIAQGGQQMSAAPVANFLLDLTKGYARMYHEHSVLQAASDELLRARLQLGLCVAQVLRNALRILTIDAPDRM